MSALVVGSSSGIGLEYAVQLALRGLSVVVTSRTARRAQGAASEVIGKVPGSVVEGVEVDVSQPDQASDAVHRLLASREWSVVIVSLGIGEDPEDDTTSDEYVAGVARVNVESFARIMQAAYNHLAAQPSQSYLMGCSAISTFIRVPRCSAYCSSRDFQSAYVRQLQRFAKLDGKPVSVSLNETSVVWTDSLVQKLKTSQLSDEQAAQFRKVSFETADFVQASLTRMYGGRPYILMGKIWWLVRALAYCIFPLFGSLYFPANKAPPAANKDRDS